MVHVNAAVILKRESCTMYSLLITHEVEADMFSPELMYRYTNMTNTYLYVYRERERESRAYPRE